MTSSRPLPEAVRGCWYYLPADADHIDAQTVPHETISFGVDGSFERYEINSKGRKEAESGEYSFDGNFLILRGRRTLTFRVHRPTYWHWKLEGKKRAISCSVDAPPSMNRSINCPLKNAAI